MRYKILIIAVVFALAMPPSAHALGVFRWAWDAVANQLGLDRGPVPKVYPRPYPPQPDPRDQHKATRARYPWFYIQAEGF